MTRKIGFSIVLMTLVAFMLTDSVYAQRSRRWRKSSNNTQTRTPSQPKRITSLEAPKDPEEDKGLLLGRVKLYIVGSDGKKELYDKPFLVDVVVFPEGQVHVGVTAKAKADKNGYYYLDDIPSGSSVAVASIEIPGVFSTSKERQLQMRNRKITPTGTVQPMECMIGLASLFELKIDNEQLTLSGASLWRMWNVMDSKDQRDWFCQCFPKSKWTPIIKKQGKSSSSIRVIYDADGWPDVKKSNRSR